MTIIIKCFANYCDSTECKTLFEKCFETHKMTNYGPNKDVYITDQEDYTHIIILNTGMPQIKKNIKKENIIGFACEPIFYLGLTPDFVHYAEKNIHKYYIGDKYDLRKPFVEGYGYLWHNAPLQHIPIKKNTMSIMVSQKQNAPGHKYRHTLVERILSLKLPVDIYGRGSNQYKQIFGEDNRIKGNFDYMEPYESYHYHICIENFQSNHYFSEKIVNTLLCGTTPLYLGCKNIESYLPNSSITLSGEIEKDIELIYFILQSPNMYKKNIDVEKIKQKTNFLKNLDMIFG